MQSKTIVLAITGNIGSGKSTVLKLFKKFGAKTINADKIVEKLYKKKELMEKILKKFKTLKKRKIAKIAFSDQKKRKFLEKLLQPAAFKEITKQVEEFKKEKIKIIAVEVPLLFEAKWHAKKLLGKNGKAKKLFDKIIAVKAGKIKRLNRLKGKGFSEKEFLEREQNQIPLKQKIKLSDFIIDNSKTLNETEKQVEKIVKNHRLKSVACF